MPANRTLWLTLLCACLVSWFYFGDIWRAPDSYLFTSSGDGLQGYYQTAWHARYDSADWRQQSLNYPFGESIFFTGGQPLLSNTARWLGGSDAMISVTNVFMLCSGIVATLLVYLILLRLGVSGVYASVYSLGIVMLSQQWERLGGHFALSVLWAIPLVLWLLLRYFDDLKSGNRNGWIKATGMAAVLFFLGLVQLYYLFFAAALMAAFALVYLFRSGIQNKTLFLVQSFLMFAVPFFLLQMLMHASSEVTDRTAIPWGFLIFRSSFWSYFYPFGMPYESWFAFLKPSAALEWEGLAYLGLSTLLAALVGFLIKAPSVYRKFPTGPAANALLALVASGALCMVVSFAFPFNVGFEALLYQLGPVQQFRGIGRFAFVAYYPLLIFVFAVLFRALMNNRWKHIIASALAVLLLVEGHARMSSVSKQITNKRETVLSGDTDKYALIDASKYQAIHPLPYVHIGSENIGFTASDDAMRTLYDASYALGLPSSATVMSRTSLSQSFLSCAMEWELMETPAIIKQLPDSRPLLVLADQEKLSQRHRTLLALADSLFADGKFVWYSLPLTAFEEAQRLNEQRARELAGACAFGKNGEWSDDSLRRFVYADTTHTVRFSRGWTKLFQQASLPEWQSDTVAVSFWVSDFSRDLIPRTVVEFIQYDASQKVIDYQTEFMGKRVVGMRGTDALVEYTLNIQPECSAISMAIENKLIQGQSIQINSFLMRPQSMNCRILRNENESLNNRNYSR